MLSALGLTSYGVWSYYKSVSTWPPEIATDLRAALKARNDGHVQTAEAKFRSAIARAEALGESEIRGDKLIKVTGIAIALASMFEDAGFLDQAYEVYRGAWESCRKMSTASTSSDRAGTERVRAVTLSQKAGQVAQRIAEDGPASNPQPQATAVEKTLQALQQKERGQAGEVPEPAKVERSLVLPSRAAASEAAETHLSWAVEELFRLTMPQDVQDRAKSVMQKESQTQDQPSSSTSTSVQQSADQSTQGVTQNTVASLAELDLPAWVSQTDLLSSIESLGSVYASQGRTEYAAMLYTHAIEFLLPSTQQGQKAKGAQGKPVSPHDACKAATIMNNLSHLWLQEHLKSSSGSGSDGNVAKSSEAVSRMESANGGSLALSSKWAKNGLRVVQKVGSLPSSKSGDSAEAEEAQTRLLRRECAQCEMALLINLGHLSTLTKDDCDARKYLQQAWRVADQNGFREGKLTAASMLSRLERFGDGKA